MSTDMNRQRLIANLSHDLIKFTKTWEEKDLPKLVHLVCELVEAHHLNYSKKEMAKDVLNVVFSSLENVDNRDIYKSICLEMVDRFISISSGETNLNTQRKRSVFSRVFCCMRSVNEKEKCSDLLGVATPNVPLVTTASA